MGNKTMIGTSVPFPNTIHAANTGAKKVFPQSVTQMPSVLDSVPQHFYTRTINGRPFFPWTEVRMVSGIKFPCQYILLCTLFLILLHQFTLNHHPLDPRSLEVLMLSKSVKKTHNMETV